LHEFVQLISILDDGENAEDLSVTDLIIQSSKPARSPYTTASDPGKGREGDHLCAAPDMQAILAKVLQEEFDLPIRIINGDTKLRAAGTLSASGLKTRNAILKDFRNKPGFNALILSPFVAGIGLTIVEANHVVHYGGGGIRPWSLKPLTAPTVSDRLSQLPSTSQSFGIRPGRSDHRSTSARHSDGEEAALG